MLQSSISLNFLFCLLNVNFFFIFLFKIFQDIKRGKMNNLSTFESNFGRMSPVECYKLNAIAVFYIVLFVFSSVVNFGVIWAIYVIKEKKGPLQWLIIFHSILNIIATLSELPFLIVSCFKCR